MHTIDKEKVKKLFELFNSLDIALHNVGGSCTEVEPMCPDGCEGCETGIPEEQGCNANNVRYAKMWVEFKAYIIEIREHAETELPEKMFELEQKFK